MTGTPSTFARRLLGWYALQRRDLPWRVGRDAPADARPDPYHVLVSEAMLQQTQVATVVPYFNRFIARYPTIAALAAADEQDVLRLWQGLGYYSRARNLHGTAKILNERHGGELPADVAQLMSLPGIGRYTAGAIASLAFDVRAPILDGNVMRVLCRLDGVEADPRTVTMQKALWARAEEVMPQRRAGDFNSAMMELGAMVCVPSGPACAGCPVVAHCEAAAAGKQDRIPPARAPKDRPVEKRWVFCIECDGRFLIEQRPPAGRWAGMWQFVTMDAGKGSPHSCCAAALAGMKVAQLRPLGRVSHGLTHRQYEFEIYHGRMRAMDPAPARRWASLAELGAYPLPKPHVRIMQMLGATGHLA